MASDPTHTRTDSVLDALEAAIRESPGATCRDHAEHVIAHIAAAGFVIVPIGQMARGEFRTTIGSRRAVLRWEIVDAG